MAYTYSQLEAIWINNGGNKAYAPIAAAIAMAESGGSADATNHNTNGSTDRGLWQINSTWGALSTYDVNANAKAAIQISNNGANWKPWTTYNTGAYFQFLQGNVPASNTGTTAQPASTTGIPGLGFLAWPGEITKFFSEAQTFVDKLMWLAMPSSWLRIGAFLVGVALLLIAIRALIAAGEGAPIMPPMPNIVPVPI